MVVLPTPARAAIASMDSSEIPMPSAIMSIVASMIAFSAFSLRGRPGVRTVPVCSVTMVRSHYRRFLAFRTSHRRGDLLLARKPLGHHRGADEGDDRAADRGDVHTLHERLLGRLDERGALRAEGLGDAQG